MKNTTTRLAITVAMLASFACLAQDVAKPRTKSSSLPPVWQGVEPSVRLSALRVAELDATRLLIERIYGVQLDSQTTVYDLALDSDKIAAQVRATIKGVSNTEDPEYMPDGTVQVVRSVKLRQVLETITQTLKQLETKRGLITLEQMQKVELENKDTVIKVMGNGAIPNSEGLRKIQAKRAAEVDAYRKLAERLMGLEITSSTTVKNFVLESDEIRARCAAMVKGAKPIDIVYDTDNSCEVKMQLKVAEIIEVIKHYARSKPSAVELTKIEREYNTKSFTETGRGAPRPLETALANASSPKSEIEAVDGAFHETEIIIKRVVGEKIVVE